MSRFNELAYGELAVVRSLLGESEPNLEELNAAVINIAGKLETLEAKHAKLEEQVMRWVTHP
jgi:hypothetical protein